MPETRFTALVFDLDGTLVDSAPDLRDAINVLLAEAKRPPLNLQQIITMIGDGAAKLVERALAASNLPHDPDAVGRQTARFIEIYETDPSRLTVAYPGVPETLSTLRYQGYRLGVCTNKPHKVTMELLAALDLLPYFVAVIGGDSLPGIRKPDPRPLLAAVEQLGAAVNRAVMIGDGINDVETARGAGMPVIVRAGGYTRIPVEDLGADTIIVDFTELPKALARLT